MRLSRGGWFCGNLALGFVVVYWGLSEANLLIPDGGGTGDSTIEKKGSETAAGFLRAVARTYVMLSKVEMKDFAGAAGDAGAAMLEFRRSSTSCGELRSAIANNERAQKSVAARKGQLKEFKSAYAAGNMIPEEESKQWQTVFALAEQGNLRELVGLCQQAATRMADALESYHKVLGVRAGPSATESWRMMNRLEQELLLLRYGAILVEGPVGGK